MNFLWPVHAAGQGQLDVGGARWPGDEVDDGTRHAPRRIGMERFQHGAHLLQRLEEAGPIEDGHVGRRQEGGRARPSPAGDEDERARLGESPVHAGDADLRAPRGIPVELPRRNLRTSLGPEGDRVSLGAEACPQVESERSRVPRQHALRLSRLGNMLDHPGHLVQSRHAVEDSRDALELLAEALEGPRPSLGHLPLDHLEGLARVERARDRTRFEEAPGLAHLPPDTAEELRARGHDRSSSFHRSLKVRAATGGRSRVRVHVPKKNGRARTFPSLTKGRWAMRPSLTPASKRPGEAMARRARLKSIRSPQGAIFSLSRCSRSSTSMRGMSMRTGQTSLQAPQSEEACARSLTAAFPLSMAVSRMPMGPGYV